MFKGIKTRIAQIITQPKEKVRADLEDCGEDIVSFLDKNITTTPSQWEKAKWNRNVMIRTTAALILLSQAWYTPILPIAVQVVQQIMQPALPPQQQQIAIQPQNDIIDELLQMIQQIDANVERIRNGENVDDLID